MAASFSSYEKQRQKNIEENRKVLQSLGLLNGGLFPRRRQVGDCKDSRRCRKTGVKRKRSETDSHGRPAEPNSGFKGCYTRRWSRRLEGKQPKDYGSLDFELEDEDDEDRPVIKRQIRISENVFGSIPGISVGTTWASRLDCSRDGVHRPTVAGIHGNESEGCYSIALSGGYEDDLDFGLAFTYTGAGGRDLKGTKTNPKNLRTAPQSKDQMLTRSNLALSRNVENRQPVRVIRGYKLDSPYAPEEGYRYDGLYTVERFWQATGLSGFMVYKFALKRCEDQAPYPWKLNVADLINGDYENGELPENELEVGKTEDKLEVEERRAENSGAQEGEKCTIVPLDQKAGSTENGDAENGELSEEEPSGAKEISKELEAKNTEEQTAVSLENGEQQIGELSVSDSAGEENPAECNTGQALTLSAQNGVTQESSLNGAEADREVVVREQEQNTADVNEQKGPTLSPRELNGDSAQD